MPDSYIVAKQLFKKTHFGVTCIFAEIIEAHAKSPEEKLLAEKIMKVKPKLKVMPSMTDSFMNSCKEYRHLNQDYQNSLSNDSTQSSIIVIEHPVFTDLKRERVFQSQTNDDDEDD